MVPGGSPVGVPDFDLGLKKVEIKIDKLGLLGGLWKSTIAGPNFHQGKWSTVLR